MNICKGNYLSILLLFLSLFLSGCLGTQYLKEGEMLLNKQKITNYPPGIPEENLDELIIQKPNSRMPIIPISPYIGLYQIGKNKFDSTTYLKKIKKVEQKFDDKISKENDPNSPKVKNWASKKIIRVKHFESKLAEGNNFMKWGEALSIHTEENTKETTRKIKKFLDTEGYFNSTITVKTRKKRKKYNENYVLTLNEPHRFDSIQFVSKDSLLIDRLKKDPAFPYVNKNQRYSETTLKNVRFKMEGYLKDHGYFDFNSSYITVNVDTLNQNKKVDLIFNIETPNELDKHPSYFINRIIFTTDVNEKFEKIIPSKEKIKNVEFVFSKKQYKHKYLADKVNIITNKLYNKTDVLNTQRQLASLDMFKFVNVKFEKQTDSITCRIYTAPLKKFQTNTELGLNVSEQGFPGPLAKFSFKNRNLTRRLDILDFNSSASIEGLPSPTDVNQVFQSQVLTGNFRISFPSFIFPYGNKLKNKFNLQDLRTQFTLGVDYTNRPDYIRNSIKTTMGYRWKKGKSQYLFTLNDLAVITTPFVSDEFVERLLDLFIRGNSLINSFRPSLVSSISFHDVIRFNNYGTQKNKSAYLKFFIESGGTALNLYKNFVDTPDGLEFYQFLKFETDYRQILRLSKNNNLALRFKFGIARPYGTNNALPYEKHFFSGGSNSNRAWAPRRLGPGSSAFFDKEGFYIENFEQFGDIQIESSVELRRNIIGFIEGALFMDVGNVWTILDSDIRPNSQFAFDRFWKELAVGAGIGLRFDFDFLVFRFDTALKVLDPARPEGSRFILSKSFESNPFSKVSLVNYNIGIGYPF